MRPTYRKPQDVNAPPIGSGAGAEVTPPRRADAPRSRRAAAMGNVLVPVVLVLLALDVCALRWGRDGS
jgi:hypothetical protein